MAKFKVGDRVRVITEKHGQDQYGKVGTVSEVDMDSVLDVEIMYDESLGKLLKNQYRTKELELIPPTASATHAIRTVTRREIVPGVYTLPKGGTYEISPSDEYGDDMIGVDGNDYTANALREMAAVFISLAEVLEENAKEAA